jgi:transcription initiation factor TFIIF subunit beta
MADPSIKPDPDAAQGSASPAAFSDDDIYEDAGDLEFNPDPNFQKLYLARVPKYVWDAWSNLDEDAEIRIGTIRQASHTGADGQPQVLNYSPTHMFIFLTLGIAIAIFAARI